MFKRFVIVYLFLPLTLPDLIGVHLGQLTGWLISQFLNDKISIAKNTQNEVKRDSEGKRQTTLALNGGKWSILNSMNFTHKERKPPGLYGQKVCWMYTTETMVKSKTQDPESAVLWEADHWGQDSKWTKGRKQLGAPHSCRSC